MGENPPVPRSDPSRSSARRDESRAPEFRQALVAVFGAVALLNAAPSFAAFQSEGAAPRYECDRSVEEFRRTGSIRCGHFLWDLHPEHAGQMEDPLAYFERYERFYRFMKDLTGVEPDGPIPVRERCWPGSPEDEACPKGNLAHAHPAYRSGNELYVDSAVVGRDVVFAANHPRRPLYSSFLHEIGHMFTPSNKQDIGYRWDPAMSESWADNLALLGYGMYSEARGLDESWYWDAYCERKAGQAPPCDAFFETVDQYASMDIDTALADYEEGKRGFDDIVPVPVTDEDAPARGHILSGMLVELYRDAKAKGRGRQFVDGLRDLVRFYHLEFPYPATWKDAREDEQGRELVRHKAEIFVFLLSASMKEDLTRRFTAWRWPVSSRTRVAVGALKRLGWSDGTKRKLLASLLSAPLRRDTPPSTDEDTPAAWTPAAQELPKIGGRDPPQPRQEPAQGRRDAESGGDLQFAGVAPVKATPRSMEDGAHVPAPPGNAPPGRDGLPLDRKAFRHFRSEYGNVDLFGGSLRTANGFAVEGSALLFQSEYGSVELAGVGVEASWRQLSARANVLAIEVGAKDKSNLRAEVLEAEAGIGTKNPDGSTGLNAGAEANLMGVEGTLNYSGNSVTGGLQIGVGASGSIGLRDSDNDGKSEGCMRVSLLFITLGACTESPLTDKAIADAAKKALGTVKQAYCKPKWPGGWKPPGC